MSQIDIRRRPSLYYHLYSYCSVKASIHWFQIIKARRFQMFDDAGSRNHCPPRYDARTVECPVVAFVGGKDTIADVDLYVRRGGVRSSCASSCAMWRGIDDAPRVLVYRRRHATGCAARCRAPRPCSWSRSLSTWTICGGGGSRRACTPSSCSTCAATAASLARRRRVMPPRAVAVASLP